MKKIMSIIALCITLLGATGCNQKGTVEAPTCGGYGNTIKPTDEDLAVWAKGVEINSDIKDYTVIEVSRQVVAGMNYKFTCRDKQGNTHTVVVFKPLTEDEEYRVYLQ